MSCEHTSNALLWAEAIKESSPRLEFESLCTTASTRKHDTCKGGRARPANLQYKSKVDAIDVLVVLCSREAANPGSCELVDLSR